MSFIQLFNLDIHPMSNTQYSMRFCGVIRIILRSVDVCHSCSIHTLDREPNVGQKTCEKASPVGIGAFKVDVSL